MSISYAHAIPQPFFLGRKTRQSFFRAEQRFVRDVLTELRQEAGLSQRQLSKKLGLAETYIARIERGERTLDLIEFIDIVKATKADARSVFDSLLRRLGD